MSWEGYEQHLCKAGHYFENYDYNGWFGDEDKPKCPTCGEPSTWFNVVDETNGSPQGIISDKSFQDCLLLVPAKEEVCNLGHVHTISEAVFRIPNKEETEALREYFDD